MQEDHMNRFKILFRYNRSRTLGIFICALLRLLNCLPVFAAEAYTASGVGTRDPAEQGSEDAGAGAFTKVSSNAAIGTAGVERQNEERILDVTDLSNRVSVLYMRDNGLPTSDANDVVQSDDGFIWIASYGGLVRYDGNNFYRYDASVGVSNTTCLYVDSKGRLWGGSNDKGAFVKEREEFTFFRKESGLQSVFIRAICEDEHGNILIGSEEGIDYIEAGTDLHALSKKGEDSGSSETQQESENAENNAGSQKGVMVHALLDERLRHTSIKDLRPGRDHEICGITYDGALFTIRDLKVTSYYTAEMLGIEGNIEDWCQDRNDPEKVYIATSPALLWHGTLDESGEWEQITTGWVNTVNKLDIVGGILWVCADNGIWYLNEGKVIPLENSVISSTVGSVMMDYQGNLWFTSNRQGVMKYVKNRFKDLFKAAGMGETVVNATYLHEEDLYIGTDVGLFILDKENHMIVNRLTDYMADSRIRCITEDSKGNLWITARTEQGLVCYDSKTDTYENFSEENGSFKGRTRAVMERNDGTIAVGTNEGVHILSDRKVVRTYDSSNGMDNAEVLCLEETEDGRLLMGTDGGGIYVEDGDTVRNIGLSDGLESEVILRIRQDLIEKDLFWIITGSSIAYMRDWKVTTLHHFPYTNNFDIIADDAFAGGSSKIWVLSSNGIYVVRRNELLADKADMTYSVLDQRCGLTSMSTANSYSFLSNDGVLYISGNKGVCTIDIDENLSDERNLRMAVPYLLADSEYIWPENGVFYVSAKCKRLSIPAFVFTYTLDNPYITCQLEGFDPEPIHVMRDDLDNISYTNLEGGSYEFILTEINMSNGQASRQISVKIEKRRAVHEYRFFWPVLFTAITAFIAAGLSVYFRWKSKREKEQERVQAEQELAAHIQMSALPAVFPAFPGRKDFDVYATMTPAREVGGDFYDFFLVDDDHLAMVIADVSGKGVPAAMFMMTTKTLIQNRAKLLNEISPAAVLADVNEQVCAQNEAEMFVTVWMAIVDLKTGDGLSANAGHEHPVLKRAGGQYELIKYRHSPAIGAMEGIRYRERKFHMEPGDAIYVYTDGVPEAQNAAKQFFGTDRMLDALNRVERTASHAGESGEDDASELKEVTTAVKDALDQFVKNAPQFDDITMLCFRYHGN